MCEILGRVPRLGLYKARLNSVIANLRESGISSFTVLAEMQQTIIEVVENQKERSVSVSDDQTKRTRQDLKGGGRWTYECPRI